MIRILYAVLIYSLLLPFSFGADAQPENPETQVDEAFVRLLNAKCLKCAFENGTVVDWRNGSPKLEHDKMSNDIFFSSIDLHKKTAVIIGNMGSTEINAYAGSIGVTFIETTGLGWFIFTTVFADTSSETGDYIAVMSKHASFLSPMPSQFHGTCKIWE